MFVVNIWFSDVAFNVTVNITVLTWRALKFGFFHCNTKQTKNKLADCNLYLSHCIWNLPKYEIFHELDLTMKIK